METYSLPFYIREWIRVLENMHFDNTYKPAWARAILDCLHQNDFFIFQNRVQVTFDSIARRVIRYYWNQICFFDLKQSTPSKRKEAPVIVQHVKKLIDSYFYIINLKKPIWFSDALCFFEENVEKKSVYEKTIKDITNVFPQNVAFRFKNIDSKIVQLYEYQKGERAIYFSDDQVKLLQQYYDILVDIDNLKWVSILERFKDCPRKSQKVITASKEEIHRNNLGRYKKALCDAYYNISIYDFYTDTIIALDNISVDHVIPWTYLYSDDIWNLVLTSKSFNSQKGDLYPSKNVIEKLKKRNAYLLERLPKKSQFYQELSFANQHNYVDRFYQNFILSHESDLESF